jgi:twinkle protein
METIEQFAHNAARPGAKNTSNACPSQSIETDAGGTVGIAHGTEENFTTSDRPAISKTAEAWARDARHISRTTLERLGVASATAYFPDLEHKSEALVFKYPEGWKARAFPGKSFVAGKGFKLAFWNIERVIAAAPARVDIAIAMVQA